MQERDPNIVTSGLSGIVVEQGIAVNVNIIRLESEQGGSLEVENERGTSPVWKDTLPTDEEKGMSAFLGQAVVIPFRR